MRGCGCNRGDRSSKRAALRIVVDGRYIQDGFPGIGRYAYHLIRALGGLVPDDTLLVLHTPGAPNSRYDVAALGRLPGIRLVATRTARRFPAEQLLLPLVVRRLGADLFHAPFYLKPLALPCPSVVTVHDLIPLRYPRATDGPAARLFFRLSTRVACRTSRAVLVPSEWTRRDVATHVGLAPGRLHVVPLAADRDRFRPQSPAAVAAVRRRHGLPTRYVVAVGSNEPHKNLRGLLAAWAEVARAAPDVALVLAGRESPYLPSRRALVDAGPCAAGVVVLGDVPDAELPALYAGAACYVHPALAEGFGLTVLEAMACGTAVVCSRDGALPEVAGDAAVLADPTDAGELAAAIRSVLDDASLRSDLGRRGVERSARFSWEATARATRDVYRSAAR